MVVVLGLCQLGEPCDQVKETIVKKLMPCKNNEFVPGKNFILCCIGNCRVSDIISVSR